MLYRNRFKCRLLSFFSVNHSYIPSDPTPLSIDYNKSLVLLEIKLIIKMKRRNTPLYHLSPSRTKRFQHANLESVILQVHFQRGLVPLSPSQFRLQRLTCWTIIFLHTFLKLHFL